MTYVIHTISGAPRAWRVLLGLTFKGLDDYEIRYLEGSKREHKAPAFLKLNPRGTVPVLTAGDVVLRESVAILAWLDRRHADRPLFGSDPAEAAGIWQRTMDCCEYLRAASHALLLPIFGGAADRHREPDAEEMPALKAAARTMDGEICRLEDALSGRPFLAGDAPTAADAVAFPEVRLVQRAVETRPELMSALGFGTPSALYPNVAAWKKRIEALPGFDRTMPPHWRAAA